MKKAIIFREYTDDQGTPGRWVSNNFSCFSLELPWRDNKSGLSCITGGTSKEPKIYVAQVVNTPKHGLVYMLQDTEPRTAILEHSGNLAGDITKGFKTHVLGCILLGKYRGILQGQKAILYSRPTVKAMMSAMNNEPVKLSIIDLWR